MSRLTDQSNRHEKLIVDNEQFDVAQNDNIFHAGVEHHVNAQICSSDIVTI